MFARKIFAPLAFFSSFTLVYSICMSVVGWAVLQENKILPSQVNDIIPSWGTHNILFLIGIVLSSGVSSFICGAVWKTETNVNISLICSLLITLVSAVIYFKHPQVEFAYQFNSFPITSLIAVLACNFYAYGLFKTGIEIQKNYIDETTLGIANVHWFWLLLPLPIGPTYFWGVGFLYALGLLIKVIFIPHENILFFILGYIPILFSASFVVMIWGWVGYRIYEILTFKLYIEKTRLSRFLIVVLTYILGCLAAFFFQFVFYLVTTKYISFLTIKLGL